MSIQLVSIKYNKALPVYTNDSYSSGPFLREIIQDAGQVISPMLDIRPYPVTIQTRGELGWVKQGEGVFAAIHLPYGKNGNADVLHTAVPIDVWHRKFKEAAERSTGALINIDISMTPEEIKAVFGPKAACLVPAA